MRLVERHYVPEWPIASSKEELSWYAAMSEVDIVNSFKEKSSWDLVSEPRWHGGVYIDNIEDCQVQDYLAHCSGIQCIHIQEFGNHE